MWAPVNSRLLCSLWHHPSPGRRDSWIIFSIAKATSFRSLKRGSSFQKQLVSSATLFRVLSKGVSKSAGAFQSSDEVLLPQKRRGVVPGFVSPHLQKHLVYITHFSDRPLCLLSSCGTGFYTNTSATSLLVSQGRKVFMQTTSSSQGKIYLRRRGEKEERQKEMVEI